VAEGLSLNFYFTISALMMVHQFDVPEEQVGYYVGYLATAYYIGQFICSFPLSAISDRVGRKKVLLLGVTFNIICQLAFGLSKWFWFAVGVRFINGVTNSSVPVSKNYVRDISDISNQARLFSFRSIGFAIGSMVAPLIGSIFSRPAESDWSSIFPFFRSPIFVEFPYFLVCFVVSLVDILLDCPSFVYGRNLTAKN